LESLAYPFAAGHEFLDAAADAALLAGDEGLGCEVVDAVVEAVGDEVGEHPHEFGHLLALHTRLELALLSSCQTQTIHTAGFVELSRLN